MAAVIKDNCDTSPQGYLVISTISIRGGASFLVWLKMCHITAGWEGLSAVGWYTFFSLYIYNVCIYLCVNLCVCTRVKVCAWEYIWVCVVLWCVYLCASVCESEWICVCAWMYMCVLYVCGCMRVYRMCACARDCVGDVVSQALSLVPSSLSFVYICSGKILGNVNHKIFLNQWKITTISKISITRERRYSSSNLLFV